MDPMTEQFLIDGGELPRSYEDLGKRLGYSDEELREMHSFQEGDEKKKIPPRKGPSYCLGLIYCAERDPSFYRNVRLQAAARASS